MQRLIPLLFIFFLIISCGGDITGYSNDELGEQRQEDSGLPDFSTRLTNNLLIEGERCRGGEATESEGQVFICEADQWLITVDNINTCTPEGCTDIKVIPIIAQLIGVSTQGNTDFFDIAPAIPVSEQVDDTLENVTVRFRSNEVPLVLFK
jgi:hypothetical protein